MNINKEFTVRLFRRTTSAYLSLLLAVMVVVLCAVKTTTAYQNAPQPSLSVNVDDSHDTQAESSASPCKLTEKLLTQSLANLETLTPLLILIALLFSGAVQTQQVQRAAPSEFTVPKLRIHITHCIFRE
ncbi:hypothetical protein CAG63_06885 [Vibrio sp. V37_P2S8PM304]|nr:hypothetical protein [Vibrio sp. V37_P2S8PM304]